jgi:hypothetical protein
MNIDDVINDTSGNPSRGSRRAGGLRNTNNRQSMIISTNSQSSTSSGGGRSASLNDMTSHQGKITDNLLDNINMLD